MGRHGHPLLPQLLDIWMFDFAHIYMSANACFNKSVRAATHVAFFTMLAKVSNSLGINPCRNFSSETA